MKLYSKILYFKLFLFYRMISGIKKETLILSEAQTVKKLGVYETYFSLLKGFIAIGILYMPKNCRNGGWLFTLISMIISFFITYYSVLKLI